jgi:hypothetical protein
MDNSSIMLNAFGAETVGYQREYYGKFSEY